MAPCPELRVRPEPRVSRTGGARSTDRRVGRTRALLHESLFRLIGERDYRRISVSAILERANVGRSTFYTHFADKDALFASAVQDMLRSLQPVGRSPSSTLTLEGIVGFSLPVFEHIQRHRRVAGAHMGQRGRAVLHEQLRRILTSWIAGEIGAKMTSRPERARKLAPDLLARYVASTFVLVLDWWIDQNCALSAAEVDQRFRSLVLPVLGPPTTSGAVVPRGE